jgi:invasion protein IalB
MSELRRLSLTGVLLLAVFNLANAQERSTTVYGDWTLSCVSTTTKACGLVQVQKVEGQSDPLSQITVERENSIAAAPVKISVEVHANAWLPTGVKLIPSDDLPINASFKWCTATRCHADGYMSGDDIERLRTLKTQGRIVYKNALQGEVSIPMSFKGLDEALDALRKTLG